MSRKCIVCGDTSYEFRRCDKHRKAWNERRVAACNEARIKLGGPLTPANHKEASRLIRAYERANPLTP